MSFLPVILFILVLLGIPLWFYVVFVVRAYRAQNTKRVAWLVGIPLLCILGLVWGWQSANEWGFRKKLPRSAKNIHEWSHEDGFLPDYVYFLRAEMSEEQFRLYATSLKLEPYDSQKAYRGPVTTPPWTTAGPADWWNPSGALAGAYVAQIGTDNWTIAKYENKCLYLYSIEW
jgi:hypothetical protein